MTDTNSNNNNDDSEKMRLAFEQFMLSGGKNNNNNNNNNNNKNSQEKNSNEEASTPQSTSSKSKKKKKKKRQSTGATPNKVVSTSPATTKQPSSSSSPQQPTTTTPNPKVKKRYYQLLRSFNDKVKHTWMDIDEQLLSVLQNIVSIRGRVPHEWKVLSQATRYYQAMVVEDSPEQGEEFDNNDYNGNEDDWKSYGHQETSSQSFSHHLRIDDIQLALSHDLEQHEKMLIGLRSLMSNVAECHDALGRIVDNLWQFHFEVENDEGMNKDESLEHIVTSVTSLYQMLSMELYRKQNMIPMVIDSTKDEILGMNELGKGHGVGTKKSQTLVRECCKSWKRSSSDEELLLSVMKLGES